MVHEFDLILPQQIGKGTVASVSYIGSIGRELTNYINTNLAPAEGTSTITILDTTGKGPLASGTSFTVPTYATCTLNTTTCLYPTGYLNPAFTNITEVQMGL